MSEKVKNWLRGAGSLVQIWPDTSTRARERFLQRSDAEALYGDWQRVGGDWQRVGDDIIEAAEKYADEQKTA